MNKFNLSLKGRIILLGCSLMLSQGILIAVAIQKSHSLLGALDYAVNQELPATKNLILGDMMHDSLRALVLGSFFASGNKDAKALAEFKEELDTNSEKFLMYFKNINSLKISEKSRNQLEKVSGDIQEYSKSAKAVVLHLEAGRIEQAKVEYELFNKKFLYLEEQLGSFGDAIEKEAQFQGDQGKDILSFIIWASAFGLLMSFLTSLAIYLWTRKSFDVILQRIGRISGQIKKSSISMNSGALKVKDSTIEQSAAIQESVSALSEMSSMIAQTGQNVKVSVDTAINAQERSIEGTRIMEHLAHAMGAIQKANSSLQEISSVIQNIVSKTAVINDIVFKTQLLSFNASIEAARAGTHGRGFAVVAEEVGNLAELSGSASKDIENLLGESQRKVKDTLESIQDRVLDGNRVSTTALQVFEEISKNIEEINIQVKGIGDATQQQEIGIQQTNTAMKQMDVTSQSNTDAATIAQNTANLLQRDCDDLNRVVLDITHFVNGRNSRTLATAFRGESAAEESVNSVNNEVSDADLHRLVQQIGNRSNEWSHSADEGLSSTEDRIDRSQFKKVI